MANTENKAPGPFKLQLTIRDAQNTAGSDRILLAALALRAKYSKKTGTFYCFPSYSKLVEDTQLNGRTLKRAAQRLEAAGIIRRSIRPNRSNFYHINFRLLAGAAEEAKRIALLRNLEDYDAFAIEEEGSLDNHGGADDFED